MVASTQPSNTDTSPSRWHRITYLLPLIVAAVVVATFYIFYGKFLFCSAVKPCSPLTATEILGSVGTADQIKVSVYVAKASWTLISGVHVLACLVAIVTAGIVIYHALSEYEVKTRWIVMLIAIAFAADVSLLMAVWSSQDIYSPAQQLLRATVGQVLPPINTYMRLSDFISLTGTLSLAFAACATLWQRDMNKELDQSQVLQRVRLLQPVLYVLAATLVIAVFRLAATHAWGASFLSPDGELGKTVTSLTTGIVGTLGTFFTLLIAGIYLPAALILRMRLRKVAATQDQPETWLANNGMSLTLPQSLPRVIALIGPLLAGPLGDLLVQATTALGGGGL
jgi:hypothetical protein